MSARAWSATRRNEVAHMLDLNDPKDARLYVARWVEDPTEADELLKGVNDEELLKLARQLFLYHDPRMDEAAGLLKIQ